MAINTKPKSGNPSSFSGRIDPSTDSLVGLDTSLTFKDGNFALSPIRPKRKTIGMIFGDAGTGKSTFILEHCPDPVAFIYFDHRAENAIARAQAKGRKILPSYIEYPPDIMKLTLEDSRKYGQRCVSDTMKSVEIAVAESLRQNCRTIGFDTVTEYVDLLTLAIRGRLDKAEKDYGDSKNVINRNLFRLQTLANKSDANLIFLSRAKPAPWEKGEPTGNFVPRCYETVLDIVDWAAHISLVKVKGKFKPKIKLEITKAGNNLPELGAVYTESDWEDIGPFAWVCLNQYEGSELEDWS